MANGYIEVSKHSPCPICSAGDWCCHIPAEDGYVIYRDEDDVVMAESNGCHVWRKGGYDENAVRGEGS